MDTGKHLSIANPLNLYTKPRPLHFLPRPRGDIRTRFVAKVSAALPNGCRLWTAALDRDNYGMFKLPAPGRMRRAHRVAYQVFVGPIPAGREIDHDCHTRDESCGGGRDCLHRRCVEPTHLVPVFGRINTLLGRGITAREAQQTHCLREHPFDGPNANVYLTKKGGRQCRTCKNITTQASKARRAQAGCSEAAAMTDLGISNFAPNQLPARPRLGPDDQGDCEACDHLVVSHRDDGCHAQLRTSTGLQPCPCQLARWQITTDTGSYPPPVGGGEGR